jgi:hypothetical protein
MTHLKTNPLADFNSPKRLFRLWKELSGEDLDPINTIEGQIRETKK